MNTTFGTKPFRWLPDAEVKRLIAMSSNPLLLETVYYYGLRRAEAGLIRREDVQNNGVWIHALKRRGDFKQFMPLIEPLKSKILKHLMNHGHPYLFPGYRGKGISGEAVAFIWRQVALGVGAHCLRRSRAMWFSENGRSREDCQWWLRQASLNSTEPYYTISATRAKAIAQAMA